MELVTSFLLSANVSDGVAVDRAVLHELAKVSLGNPKQRDHLGRVQPLGHFSSIEEPQNGVKL